MHPEPTPPATISVEATVRQCAVHAAMGLAPANVNELLVSAKLIAEFILGDTPSTTV